MRTLVLALVLAIGHAAMAKPREPPPQRIGDFEDEVVEAPTHGPHGDEVTARKRARQPSLIRVRQDFRREMLRSADGV